MENSNNENVKQGKCAECGCEGYICDTSAGEVMEAGIVVGCAPRGATILMVGDTRGGHTEDIYCAECAEVI